MLLTVSTIFKLIFTFALSPLLKILIYTDNELHFIYIYIYIYTYIYIYIYMCVCVCVCVCVHPYKHDEIYVSL